MNEKIRLLTKALTYAWHWSSRYKALFAITVFVVVARELMALYAVDRISGLADNPTLTDVAIGGAIMAVAIPACMWLRDVAWSRVSAGVKADVFAIGTERVLHFTAAERARESSGALVNTIERASSAYEELTDRLVYTVIPAIILIVGTAWGLAARDPWFAVQFVLVTGGVLVLSARYSLREGLPAYAAASQGENRVIDFVTDTFVCHDAVRTFAMQAEEIRGVRAHADRWVRALLAAWRVNINAAVIVQVGLGTTLLLLLTTAVLRGAAPEAVLYIITSWWLLNGFVSSFGEDVRVVVRTAAKMSFLIDILERPNGMDDAPTARPLQATGGAVEFRNVRFGYAADRAVFDGLSLTIPAGTAVALVGPSGSGKSTLAHLINRQYDPSAGAVLIDGQDLRACTLQSVRRAVAVVPQLPVMFNRSLWDNIAYANPTATSAEILDAARRARVDVIAAQCPNGYNQLVGEGGITLSGGERQRLAIARAILAQAPILILDEATSALDTASERLIQEAIQDAAKDRTVVMIAHRLSTIRWADQIVVLQNGRIVETGTHPRLLAQGGLYADLCHADAVLASHP